MKFIATAFNRVKVAFAIHSSYIMVGHNDDAMLLFQDCLALKSFLCSSSFLALFFLILEYFSVISQLKYLSNSEHFS